MRYCIAYIAQTEEVIKYFKEITTTLSDTFGIANLSHRVPPHLTLKYPFHSDDLPSIEQAVKKAIIGKKSFPIAIDGFSHFPNNSNTIFLDIKVSEENLSNIKRVICDLGEFDEDRKFSIDDHKPHISIVRKLEPQVFNQVWEYALTLPKPHFELMFDNIAILVQEDDMWNIKKVYNITI